jgi:hypothetical protein
MARIELDLKYKEGLSERVFVLTGVCVPGQILQLLLSLHHTEFRLIPFILRRSKWNWCGDSKAPSPTWCICIVW